MDEHDLFISLIKQASVPLAPALPPLPPDWEKLASQPFSGTYRAVLFDVYGTLFCSTAGDIGTAISGQPVSSLNMAVEHSGSSFSIEELRVYFHDKVREKHRLMQGKTAWPEIRAEEIWSGFLAERGLPGSGRELALHYELAVNPVYPMPHAAQTIAALRAAGCPLGIISNAQFFTPLLFEALLGGLPETIGFDPELIIYSFEQGEAKPSPRLFTQMAEKLKERGIQPSECAFVGNDMLSDIYGAMTAGFQGILFAGDSRSLRLREGNNLTGDLKPSRIIRSLDELVPNAK